MNILIVDFEGAVAQLGERSVRNAKVGSSILLRSTIVKNNLNFVKALYILCFNLDEFSCDLMPDCCWNFIYSKT